MARVDPNISAPRRRALSNIRLEELATALQAAANARTDGPTTVSYATRLEMLVGAVEVALSDFAVPSDAEADGRRAARAGVMWWNNPHPSGSVKAGEWDAGHTAVRKGLA